MRFSRIISAASSLLLCAPVFAQGWIEHASTLDGFRIQTPGEFEIEEIDYLSEYGVVFPARVYSHENDGGRYSMTVVDYRDSQRLHEERIRELNDIYLPVYGQVDVRGSIAYAATNLRQRGGEITYDAYHYVNRVDGHQLQMINPDGTRTYAAIYLRESRLYILDATVNPGTPPGGMFQQSLEFIDENGETITYRNFEDVVKVINVQRR